MLTGGRTVGDGLNSLSSTQVFMWLISSAFGPGLLSLPFVFCLMGPTCAPVLVCFLGFLAVFNMFLLLDSKLHVNRRITDVNTYGEVALYALGIRGDWLGKAGKRVVDTLIVFVQFDVCIVYFDFISDNLNAFFPQIPQRALIFLLVVPVALLTMKEDMRRMAPVALVGTGLAVVGVVLVVMQA